MATTYPLTPDYIKSTTPEFKTQTVEFGNGYEQTSPLRNNPKITFKLTHKLMSNADLATLHAHFIDRKGKHLKFNFYDHRMATWHEVKFKSDALPEMHLNAKLTDIEVELITC